MYYWVYTFFKYCIDLLAYKKIKELVTVPDDEWIKMMTNWQVIQGRRGVRQTFEWERR